MCQRSGIDTNTDTEREIERCHKRHNIKDKVTEADTV